MNSFKNLGVFVSLRFIGSCLSPLVVFYLYDCIFSATSQTKPGAFFLASATITFLVLVCFWYVYLLLSTYMNFLIKSYSKL